MLTRQCNHCQEEYLADPRYLNRGQGLFCSRKCSGAFYGPKRKVQHQPNTACAWCKIQFYRPTSKKKSASGLYYCSKVHQAQGVTQKQYVPGPKVIENKTETSCIDCHKNIKSLISRCKECNLQYLITSWLNGDNAVTLTYSKRSGLPSDTKSFVKKYLIQVRGDRCEVCGWDEKASDGRSIIQMDHINGNCFDNRLENLKLLCPNHHAMTPTYGSRNRGSGRAHRRKN